MRLISKCTRHSLVNKQLQYIYCPMSHEAMKPGQAMEYCKRNTFLQKSCWNVAERLVPDIFLVFKEALDEVKASGLQVSFNIVW